MIPRFVIIWLLFFGFGNPVRPCLDAKESAWVEMQDQDFHKETANFCRTIIGWDVLSVAEGDDWKPGDLKATGFINAVRLHLLRKR